MRALAFLAVVFTLAGCASSSGSNMWRDFTLNPMDWFGGTKASAKMAPLPQVTESVKARVLWQASVGASGSSVFTPAAVGDRVRLRRIQIDDGAVVLDVVQPGPREPRCCGTQLARKAYRLESGGLREVASQAVGRLSLATIARIEWQLEEMNGRPPAPGSQVPTFEISGDTASGFGGCNRYSGAIKESAPGRISLGDLASTRMACGDEQMALEDAYLRDLRKVSSYTFLAGSLALEWHDGDRHGLLVFRRRE
jgi:heat shock protein HslJ